VVTHTGRYPAACPMEPGLSSGMWHLRTHTRDRLWHLSYATITQTQINTGVKILIALMNNDRFYLFAYDQSIASVKV
jgi:hypothetical protein